MVARVRRRVSQRAVRLEFGVSLRTVQKWVAHAGTQRLDRVDWSDQPRGGRRAARATSRKIEDLVLRLRKELKDSSDLGEFGAAAIHRELQRRHAKSVPSTRTIGRILERRGALDGRRRLRHPAPPKGWYLPSVASRQAELDSFDIVEGFVIRGGTHVEALNGISLHGGLCASWVRSSWTAKHVVSSLIEHWRQHGLPHYAQFDNDTLFQGAHQFPDSFGRVTRLCLQLGVTPVFVVPRETGFQAAIESYNGRWQVRVWSRFQHASLDDVAGRSDRFVAACRERSAARIDSAPPRRSFPVGWILDLKRPLTRTVIFLRRTTATGHVEVLGHRYLADTHWAHRLLRVEVDLTKHQVRLYRLRRREPDQQPLIKTIPYSPPRKPFHE